MAGEAGPVISRTPAGAVIDWERWYVTLWAGDGIAIEVWLAAEGPLGMELAVCKARIDNPGDYATHLTVCGRQLPDRPWADLAGYTVRRAKPHGKAPLEAK